ncbi:hypothetical protein J5583_09045 [Streptococcus suis]|uniref:SGNH/GDSL hydrolase family protein n=1 Tax=Streptococcus suis TaxID=1307 RepID=UPI001ABDC690|nr:SGNH/GDSL hydrolase family protein [Streptococcus suis]MBO4110291.1 hypothetical protein [Streptococcus suis]
MEIFKKNYSEENVKMNKFRGQSFAIIGDSYSTFKGNVPAGNTFWYDGMKNGVTDVSQLWWHILLNQLQGVLIRNESWSGTTISTTGYEGEDTENRSLMTRSERYFGKEKVLSKQPDNIIFFLVV